ncbi:MAG: hypothetical protein WA634_18245 [Silvibacterium sp.]
MQYSLRSTFWIKTVIASVTALLAIVTALWRDWIERVFGIDLDHHSGSIEWELIVALLLAAMLFAALARREWQKTSLATAENGSAET